ncbi:TMEM43 family protein [Nitratireductor arenosus]|uniref:TMEM43 family protein n=1 Tax=Nitratireductor arenosus TaxID=2682096 RepID=UPI0031B5B638
MSDSYREVTRTSWFGRIGNSIGGVVFGLLLILAMIVGLFWNEGRAVQTARSLAEGAGIVVSVGAERIDPGKEGSLVHVAGRVTTDQEPADLAFGITAEGIRLERKVEMYQWRQKASSETKKKLGGGEETVTTYSYDRSWSAQPIDSGSFKKPEGHQNPAMRYRSQDFQIAAAKLGAFDLDGQVLGRIGGGQEVPITPGLLPSIERAFTGGEPLSIADGRIYLGDNPATSRIGDYRIAYRLVPLGTVSLVARQAGTGFAPYQTEAGDRLLMVETGTVAPEKMFADAVTGNTVLTWVLRIGGLVLLMVGFSLIMRPLGVIADVIPFLGSLVRMGTSAVAFVLAVLVGFTTIAIAWFWYRPLLSIALIVIALAAAWVVGRLGRRQAAEQAPA